MLGNSDGRYTAIPSGVMFDVSTPEINMISIELLPNRNYHLRFEKFIPCSIQNDKLIPSRSTNIKEMNEILARDLVYFIEFETKLFTKLYG